MSRNYDNWERLVAAVIKREEIWQLCNQPSRSPSICSDASSSFSSSFRSDFELENKVTSVQKPVPKILSLKRALIKITGDLGKGRFGTSILIRLQRDVQLSDQEFLGMGTELVLKKLVGEVKVTEKEFQIVFGNCSHKNVATPRAYYFSNNENYIFNDYHIQGSLSDMLHGYHPPSWKSRLKIAIGAARGIAHIHGQYGGKLAHGHITSSNIFVESQEDVYVSDFVLAGIMKMPGGKGGLDYDASDYEFKNAPQESDVYSFGVVLLQLLTGRSPVEPKGFGEYMHIVEWAHSIKPEDWSSKLFDDKVSNTWYPEEYTQHGRVFCDEISILKFGRALKIKVEGEMVKMCQVATKCVAIFPVHRPKMKNVVVMLENINVDVDVVGLHYII